ncbi:MAG: CPP1-like family protein [Prochlorococcaceae cyanobacterium]
MNQGLQHPPDDAAGADGPYERLGLKSGASFEAVQTAKAARLAEVGDDPLARSRIEAAYDAVLMERLKERQQGKVSTAALSASEREQVPAPARPSLPRLAPLRLPSANLPRLAEAVPSLPQLTPASGRELWIPLGVAGVLLALLLLGSVPAELLLALAAIGTLVALQRRNRRLLPAVGWSVAALSAGLLLGGLLLGVLDPSLPMGLPLTDLQVQTLPALLLLLLAAVLIA